MKKSADKLAIAYVIILSLIPVLALPNLIFQSHVLDAIPYDASALTTELGFFLSNLPAIIYIMLLYILGILNIWKSFSSYEEGDSTALINRMLIHKYGLVAFFLYDFILLFTLFFRRCSTDIHDRRSDYTTYAPNHECYDIFHCHRILAHNPSGLILRPAGNPHDL